MKQNRHRLSNQIMGIQTPKKQCVPKLDFESIIEKQQQIIVKLQQQIKYLRQYAIYFAGESQSQKQIQTDSSMKNGDSKLQRNKSGKQQISSLNTKEGGLKKLVKQIMSMIEVQNLDQIIPKLKIVLQKANRKIQPVFIERIKYKQVPVPMQIIREVEKQVIVYQQRIVQVPIFREKIIQKYVVKPPQPTNNSNNSQNSFISQQNSSPKQQKQEDSMKKKLNFVESPKYNQTFTMKSPRFKQKQDNKQKWQKYTNMKSPRYKQKDGY